MSLLRSILSIIQKSFHGGAFFVHVAAIVSTYFFVVSGFDWNYFLFMHTHGSSAVLVVTDIIGLLVPLFVPLALYVRGKQKKDSELMRVGRTLFASVVATFLIILAYKSCTGRVSPPDHGPLLDISTHFQFGFMREQVIGGWPSSHAAIAFAMAACVSTLYSKSRTLYIAVFTYALIIGLGVSIGWHWFSEFFAGALIGSVVGYVSAQMHKMERAEKA